MTALLTYEDGLRDGDARNQLWVDRYRELLKAVRRPQSSETPSRSHRLAMEQLATPAPSAAKARTTYAGAVGAISLEVDLVRELKQLFLDLADATEQSDVENAVHAASSAFEQRMAKLQGEAADSG